MSVSLNPNNNGIFYAKKDVIDSTQECLRVLNEFDGKYIMIIDSCELGKPYGLENLIKAINILSKNGWELKASSLTYAFGPLIGQIIMEKI